ncbi:MAG: DUF3179 domain-containing protein [Candidatus Heimdallarchaeota archaeon]
MRIPRIASGRKFILCLQLIFVISFSLPSKVQADEFFFVELVDGGVPKDGIPAIDNPAFLASAEYERTNGAESALVIGIFMNGEARAYPFDIMVWHEIVNDHFGNENYSITYCPLTGSGVAFDTKTINGSTLGTTGKLYESNLVFYDRATDTYWIQMMNFAIWGPNRRASLNLVPVVQTTWRAWKSLHPETTVLSRETGYKRNYDLDPYNDPPSNYNTSDWIWFPTTFDWTQEPYNKYHEKTWTLVVRSANHLHDNLYPYPELAKQPVINDIIGKEPLVVVYNQENQLAIPFSSTLENGTILHFSEANHNGLDSSNTLALTIFQDDESKSIWNMRGEAIAGSLKGTRLSQLAGYTAYWFAASAFFALGGAKIFAASVTAESENSQNPVFLWIGGVFLSIALGLVGCLVYVYWRKKSRGNSDKIELRSPHFRERQFG